MIDSQFRDTYENIRCLCIDGSIDYIKMTANRGVDVRTGSDPPSSMLGGRNHQSVDEHATEMILKAWDDFRRCGAFLVSDNENDEMDRGGGGFGGDEVGGRWYGVDVTDLQAPVGMDMGGGEFGKRRREWSRWC